VRSEAAEVFLVWVHGCSFRNDRRQASGIRSGLAVAIRARSTTEGADIDDLTAIPEESGLRHEVGLGRRCGTARDNPGVRPEKSRLST
jgi:hypothetical protein